MNEAFMVHQGNMW